jgi:phage-related protein (TIGR01555 family)
MLGGTRLNYAETRPQAILKDVGIYPVNRWELTSVNRFSEYYEFYGKRIHSSRVLTMAGKAAPYLIRWTLQNWGMSEVEKMVEDFNAYIRTKNVVYELLKEAKIDVYQFENFTTQLATNRGTDLTIARVELMNRVKNFQNAVVLDAKDKIEQKQITFGGLAEVMKQNMIGIASALRIPMTKLFGLSSTGFNSGEDDIENYNAMVESEVRQPLKIVIQKVIQLYCLKLFGSEFEVTFNFKPLRVMSSLDEETIKTQKHARYVSLYQQGLLTPQETMELMQNEKLIPMETEVGRGADPMEAPGHEDQGDEFGEDVPEPGKEGSNGKPKSAAAAEAS